MAKRGPRINQAEEVRRWNKEHSIGTPVTVEKDLGEIVKTKTRSVAWLLGADGQGVGGHTAVVALEGIAGGYLLSRVRATQTEPVK